MNIENIKIDFYMFLWEKYNDVFSLKEFEDKVIEHLKSSEVFRKNQKIYYKVLKDFFLAHNIAFNEVGNPIFSKLEIINYEDNIFVDFLVKKMEKMDKIFFEQESKKDIKIIKQETLSVFLHRFENVLNKQESYEIIKASIRRFLSLSKKDSIFFLNEKVVIRYFNLSKEERSEGIPVEELEKIYKKLGYEYYSQMVDKLMKELLNKELDLNYMDNLTFHRTYIKIIQQGITKKLKGDFKE
ncbi:MAG: hypothetical protein OIF32_10040, partial [Campylobacterales bacterium]|nr:hypothetical protein [Campylobacterales bacterium]